MGSGGSKSGSETKPKPKKATKEKTNVSGKKEKTTTNTKAETGSPLQVDSVTENAFEIEETLKGYPPPKPAPSDLNFPAGHFNDVDMNAQMVPASALSSFESLQESLFRGVKDDAQKVRSILVWYSSLNINRMKFPQKVDVGTPLYYLKLIQDKKMLLARFFVFVCRKTGLQCVMILGHVKAATYEVGDTDTAVKTYWAAVYVNKAWRLVQPLWATGAVAGYNKGGKVLIDDSTKTTAQRQEASAGVSVSQLDEYYIFTPANRLVNRCFPEKREWQLLKSPDTWEDYLQAPLYEQPFFEKNFSFKKVTLGIQKAEDGMCTISIKPPDIMITTMKSHLYFHEKKSNRSWEEASDFGMKVTPDKFVFKNRDSVKREIEFEIRFPAVGIYQLNLYGGENNNNEHICAFRLECDSILDDPKPYPQVPPIGYGPGPETVQGGLKPKSHRTGRVVVGIRQSVTINFRKIVQNVYATKQYKSELKSDNETIMESHTWVSESGNKKNYDIKVSPQKSGEYTLAVSAKDKQQDDSQYENICNYLIDVEEDKRKKNKNLNKIVRDNLRRALETKDIDRIQKALDQFEDRNLDDDDGLAEKARKKLEYLRLRKDLHDAIGRQRIELLESAISNAEKSAYSQKLEFTINDAKEELARLKEISGRNSRAGSSRKRNILHPTPPLDARTLLEIKQYNNPQKPVYDTMKAFLLILGENPHRLEDWEDIVRPLSQQGKQSVIRRSKLLDVSKIPAESLEESKNILSNYNSQFIRENSVSVAAFYDWSEDVIALAEKVQNENEEEEPVENYS